MKLKLNRTALQKAFAEEAEGKVKDDTDPIAVAINNCIVIAKEFHLTIDEALNMPCARYLKIEKMMQKETKKIKDKK